MTFSQVMLSTVHGTTTGPEAIVRSVTGLVHVVATRVVHATSVIQPARHAMILLAQDDLMNVLHVTAELSQILMDTAHAMTITKVQHTHVSSSATKDVRTVLEPASMNAFSVKITTI